MRLAEWLKGIARPDETERREKYDAGDRAAVEPLMGALKDANPAVRKRAVIALGDIGDARAACPIITLLNDADDDVRCFHHGLVSLEHAA